MQVWTHKNYDKAWAKLSDGQKGRVKRALILFLSDPGSSQLRLHQLKGKYYPQYSLSIGGDLRVHFQIIDDATIRLMIVGTHSQLYK